MSRCYQQSAVLLVLAATVFGQQVAIPMQDMLQRCPPDIRPDAKEKWTDLRVIAINYWLSETYNGTRATFSGAYDGATLEAGGVVVMRFKLPAFALFGREEKGPVAKVVITPKQARRFAGLVEGETYQFTGKIEQFGFIRFSRSWA